MKRILPAFCAASMASMAPPWAKMRSGSSRRMTSWNCMQVDVVGLQPPQRLVDLPGGRLLRAAVDLGHEKDLLAVAVAKRLAHADFALALRCSPSSCP